MTGASSPANISLVISVGTRNVVSMVPPAPGISSANSDLSVPDQAALPSHSADVGWSEILIFRIVWFPELLNLMASFMSEPGRTGRPAAGAIGVKERSKSAARKSSVREIFCNIISRPPAVAANSAPKRLAAPVCSTPMTATAPSAPGANGPSGHSSPEPGICGLVLVTRNPFGSMIRKTACSYPRSPVRECGRKIKRVAAAAVKPAGQSLGAARTGGQRPDRHDDGVPRYVGKCRRRAVGIRRLRCPLRHETALRHQYDDGAREILRRRVSPGEINRRRRANLDIADDVRQIDLEHDYGRLFLGRQKQPYHDAADHESRQDGEQEQIEDQYPRGQLAVRPRVFLLPMPLQGRMVKRVQASQKPLSGLIPVRVNLGVQPLGRHTR